MIRKLLIAFLVLGSFTMGIGNAFSAILSWDPVLNDPDVEGYEIHTGYSSGVYDQAVWYVPDKRVARWTMNNTTDEFLYVAIRAYGGAGALVSRFSNELILEADTYPYPVFHVDMDNDGLQDLLQVRDDGVYVVYANTSIDEAVSVVASNFSPNNGWLYDRHIVGVGYLNTDQHLDIYGFGQHDVIVAYGNGTSFSTPEVVVTNNLAYGNGWSVTNHLRGVRDFNGDGRGDFYGIGYNGLVVAYANPDGTYDAPIRVLSGIFGYGNGWRNPENPRGFAMVDDDDLLDVYGFGNGGVYVSSSIDGLSFGAPVEIVDGNLVLNQGWISDRHPRGFYDVNGDGRTDVYGYGNNGLVVAYNLGGGVFDYPVSVLPGLFGYNQGWSVDDTRIFFDYNNDGLPDIFAQNGSETYIAESIDGESFYPAIML